jgi:hypothetical protein
MLWRWRQQTPLKCRQTSTRLHGAATQKTTIFILANMRTWNLTGVQLSPLHTCACLDSYLVCTWRSTFLRPVIVKRPSLFGAFQGFQDRCGLGWESCKQDVFHKRTVLASSYRDWTDCTVVQICREPERMSWLVFVVLLRNSFTTRL